ncbi:telomere length regulation protein TEL2 homolog [Carassius gibelio]|uniref:telomere length regulation protein TEL2 homolog n=1 Tax=Carassius gibelio TaxID=101364 RepID=UPI002279678F|nr:telomere length regulation protein TEL2 homolog [Carassius gibelio]XP_052451886.1 telomere length regulation protein TEL2 homolog [Carassius gibelio]XP_052451887.1 telomere length regulation protein TEL2 homolog [Carassius gibelio]
MGSAGTEVGLCLRTLSTSRDSAEIVHALRTVARYLEDSEFTRHHFTHAIQVLVSAHWFSRWCGDKEIKKLWDEMFLKGPPDQTLLLLLDTISSTGESVGLEQSASVLEKFLSAGRLQVLLWSRCEVGGAYSDTAQLRETIIISHLAALPSITCNHLHANTPDAFLPQQYYLLLATSILDTLEKTCHALRAGHDCSLGFVAQVLGKVCIQGYSAQIFETLAPRLSSLTRVDPLWQRVTQRLLEKVPERCTECVITGLIRNLSGAAAVSRLMGNLVVTNKKAQFVLTHKLLLQQYQHPTRLLKSVLGYLALDSERRTLLKQVLRSVCQVWCNSSAVKHTSVEQQLYVSKVLLLCVSFLDHAETQELRQEMLQCMLGGVQCRLDSNIERIRRMGMVVGECLSHKLDTPGSQLKFQYEPDEEITELKSLVDSPSVEDDEQHQPDTSTSLPPESVVEGSAGQSAEPEPEADSELDSDDDLTPYDMSADQEKKKSAPPRYIRDCLEALMSSDDAERVELSLKAAEALLRKNVKATQEVSVQFGKVLLHLEDRYSTAHFHTLRQNAMVALTVTDVKPVVDYWTTEFYSLNYSLRQRLDILEVLALSAQELSEPITDKHTGAQPISAVMPLEQCDDITHWRQIVEKRIQSKTRRISKGGTQSVRAVPNRYAPVAGYFFFPLLRKYDRPQVTFDLLGGDHLVLGRLLHTLGLLMHLAVNAPVASQMGRALLDFVWVVRFHTDQMVRRGVMFAVCAVFLSMPAENLLTELGDDLMETRAWLADVAENDCDADCRSLAVQSLMLLDKNLKTQLQIPDMET